MLPWQRGEPSPVTHRRMQSLATQMLSDEPHTEDDTTDQSQEIWSIIRYPDIAAFIQYGSGGYRSGRKLSLVPLSRRFQPV
jgi:hypothetical protein